MNEHAATAVNTPAVVVLLSERELPKLLPIGETPGGNITLNGRLYKDVEVGEWLGFYDWLRSESGELLGVRLWLDELCASLEPLTRCMNVTIETPLLLSVFFGSDRRFDPKASNDQDFGGNRLFAGPHGYALAFFAPAGQ
jgi:hypothetical protein